MVFSLKIQHQVLKHLLIWWLLWHFAVLAVVFWPRPEPVFVMCPGKYVVHGVGSDLRTYRKEMDTCSAEYRKYVESQ